MASSSIERLRPDVDRLIADARAGCQVSLDKLMEMLSKHLWTELGGGRKPHGLGPSHGLSDLIQDTLVRVREKFAKFERGSFADFKQWARTILYRRRQEWARNYRFRNDAVRKEQIGLILFSRMAPQGVAAAHEDAAQLKEEAARAGAAFERLKPHEQFIINLRAIEGLRYPDIEALTGWTKEAARLAYRRAIEQLRVQLQSDGKL
jgi:RNA polymerase sigma factor (sigma-70 family)